MGDGGGGGGIGEHAAHLPPRGEQPFDQQRRRLGRGGGGAARQRAQIVEALRRLLPTRARDWVLKRA